MEEITKKILIAKKSGNKEEVQRLQQQLDKKTNKILRSLEDRKDTEDFYKHGKK